MALFPFGVFDFATSSLFTRGPRTGETTKLPIADVANGFVPGDPVTPEQHNGLFNVIGEALTFLQGLLDLQNNWAAQQLFALGLDAGSALLGSYANSVLPRISTRAPQTSVAEWCVHWEGRIAAPFPVIAGHARMLTRSYSGSSGVDYAITLNAAPGVVPGQWHKDKTGQPALIAYISARSAQAGMRIARKPAGDNADWTDVYGSAAPTGWSDPLLDVALPVLGTIVYSALRLAQTLLVTGAATFGSTVSVSGALTTVVNAEIGTDLVVGNDASVGNCEVRGALDVAGDAEVGNDLLVDNDASVGDLLVRGIATNKGFSHAWGVVVISGGVVSAPNTFRLSGVARVGATNAIRIDFTDAMENADYLVGANIIGQGGGTYGTGPKQVVQSAKDVDGFTFVIVRQDEAGKLSGVVVDLDTGGPLSGAFPDDEGGFPELEIHLNFYGSVP